MSEQAQEFNGFTARRFEDTKVREPRLGERISGVYFENGTSIVDCYITEGEAAGRTMLKREPEAS